MTRTTSPLSHALTILLLACAASFATPRWAAPAQLQLENGSGTFSSADIADVNQDGIADLVIFNMDQGTLMLYPGTGADKAIPRRGVVIDSFIASLNPLKIADLDGDGLPDIVGYDQGMGNIYMWRQVPGGWERHTLNPVPIPATLGDFAVFSPDGGSQKQLAVAYRSFQYLYTLVMSPLPAAPYSNWSMTLLDSNNRRPNLTFIKAGTFYPSQAYQGSTLIYPKPVQIAIGAIGDATRLFYQELGQDTWKYAFPSHNIRGHCDMADMDLDSRQEILCLNNKDITGLMFINYDSINPGWSSIVYPQGHENIIPGNGSVWNMGLNSQGLPLLVLSQSGSGSLKNLVSLADPVKNADWNIASVGVNLVPVAHGDLQGKGSNDIVYKTLDNNSLGLPPNRLVVQWQTLPQTIGFGNMYRKIITNPAQGFTQEPAVLDVNADGKSELMIPADFTIGLFAWDSTNLVYDKMFNMEGSIVARSMRGTMGTDVVTSSHIGVFMYFNSLDSADDYGNPGVYCQDGGITYPNPIGAQLGVGIWNTVVHGAVTYDPNAGVLYECESPSPEIWNAYYWQHQMTGVPTQGNLVIADIDNDKTDEMMITTSTGYSWYWWSGTTWANGTANLGKNMAQLKFVDLDDNGTMDLVGVTKDDSLIVWLNVWNGLSRADGTAINHNTKISVEDMDGDGRLDIVGNSNGLSVWLNDGTTNVSTWSKTVIDPDYVDIGYIKVGDFNGDGRADIIAGKDGFNFLYMNRPNVYAPHFTSQGYQASVTENASVGTPVLTVAAIDSDAVPENRKLTYAILSGNDHNTFIIDALTGAISIHNGLNREAQASYHLQLQVSDNGLGINNVATSSVDITVSDVNDMPPVFQKNLDTLWLLENLATGTVVGTALASDGDIGDNALSRYDAIDGDGTDVFLVDPSSGNITLAKPLDRETKAQYTLRIKATNITSPYFADTMDYLIRILDVNDNAPVLRSNASAHWAVKEDLAGVVLGRLDTMASDADSGANATLRFQLLDPSAPFAIDSVTGRITSKATTDYETQSHWTIPVRVHDLGTPQLATTGSIYVDLLDSNEYAPHYTQDSLQVSISEKTGTETSFAQVTAHDSDATAQLSYRILSGSQGLFTIDAATGALSVSAPLPQNARPQALFAMPVEASDGLRKDTVLVQVSILDVNDSTPRFTDTTMSLSVLENTAAGTVLDTVTAVDGDGAGAGVLTWSIEDGNIDNTFAIDPSTGVLSIARAPDYEALASYRLIIQAQDNGTPTRRASKSLTVRIQDLNDVTPTFAKLADTTSIPENEAGLHSLGVFPATDIEAGMNGTVRYHIITGNESGRFTVDSLTGEVLARGPFDYESVATYALTLEAKDRGTPARSSTMSLDIRVLNRNDAPTSNAASLSLSLTKDSALVLAGLDTLFHDQDGDTLAYSLVLADTSALRVEVLPTRMLVLTALQGPATLTGSLVADDGHGGTVWLPLRLTVSSATASPSTPPLVLRTPSAVQLGSVGSVARIGNPQTFFADAQGGTLQFSWSLAHGEVAQASLDSLTGMLNLRSTGTAGTDTLTLVATDSQGDTSSLHVTVLGYNSTPVSGPAASVRSLGITAIERNHLLGFAEGMAGTLVQVDFIRVDGSIAATRLLPVGRDGTFACELPRERTSLVRVSDQGKSVVRFLGAMAGLE